VREQQLVLLGGDVEGEPERRARVNVTPACDTSTASSRAAATGTSVMVLDTTDKAPQ
jgi:hypothetical protein